MPPAPALGAYRLRLTVVLVNALLAAQIVPSIVIANSLFIVFHAYVTNATTNTVSVIDTTSDTVTATIPLGSGAFTVAFAPDGHYAYVTDAGSNSVSVIDTASNTVTATVPFVNPEGVAFAPDGRHAYITNREVGTVTVVDTGTG